MLKSLNCELTELASTVWSSMANTCLKSSDHVVGPTELTSGIVSCIHIAGSWEGSVHLEMDIDLARATTAGLLGVEESDVSADDIQDAAGELANILGGGIKELMPQPCKLSVPSVSMGFERESFSGRIALECSFVANSGRLHVSVIEKES